MEKLNVGAIGIHTPQLHIHVVGRRADDECWPEPVWGRGKALAYDDKTQAAATAAALTMLRALQAAA